MPKLLMSDPHQRFYVIAIPASGIPVPVPNLERTAEGFMKTIGVVHLSSIPAPARIKVHRLKPIGLRCVEHQTNRSVPQSMVVAAASTMRSVRAEGIDKSGRWPDGK